MDFLPHQVAKGKEALAIIRQKGIVYIQGLPRSGKTATALYVADNTKASHWLILCPKNAISGWEKFLNGSLPLNTKFTVTNYEQVYKRVAGKYTLRLNKDDYNGVILDESHNFGVLGKPSLKHKMTRLLCYEYPLILLSGSALVESYNGIYHQCYISKYSPFRNFKNFYDYHRYYGESYYIRIGGRDVPKYDKAKEDLITSIVDTFTVYMTQQDAGISTEVQAVDEVHYVSLSANTKKIYNTVQKDNIITLLLGDDCVELICDSVMKLRISLHMIESGVIKIDGKYYILGNREKIDYILKRFGDNEDVGIMSHFVGERHLLNKIFKRAKIYSSTSHAEGVDLSHLKHFIIISSGYSGAKFIQRRERCVNIFSKTASTVHHLIVKGAISEQVYKAVSNKLDFNNRGYERNLL